MKLRKRKRFCLVCGKRIIITFYPDGHYRGGYYFGILHLPIKGTGEYKKTGTCNIGKDKFDVVKWTGKKENLEYWECNTCYNESMCKCWLEEKIETVYGKRCTDFAKGCHLCEAWEFYDDIVKHGKRKIRKR